MSWHRRSWWHFLPNRPMIRGVTHEVGHQHSRQSSVVSAEEQYPYLPAWFLTRKKKKQNFIPDGKVQHYNVIRNPSVRSLEKEHVKQSIKVYWRVPSVSFLHLSLLSAQSLSAVTFTYNPSSKPSIPPVSQCPSYIVSASPDSYSHNCWVPIF